MEKRWWTRQSALVTSGIGQLEVELLDLRGQHQALVDDGAAGEGRNVEISLPSMSDVGHLVFSAAADEIEQALEGVLIHALGTADEELLDIGLRSAGFAADGVTVDGRVAPAQNLQAFCGCDAFEDAFALETAVLVNGKKDHGHAVRAGTGQLDTELAAFAGEEDVRDLDENAGAVARLRDRSLRLRDG